MKNVLQQEITLSGIAGWLFGIAVLAVGVLNLIYVHPVPGIAYLLLSFVYFPPVNDMLRERFRFAIPLALKIALGLVIIMFTLGVSDLGDIIDKL